MIDLDHFKRINDTYGHEYGNQALRFFAILLREGVRRIDIPCRYGGEEFALILPGTRLPQAARTAERMRQTLEDSSIDLAGHRITMTASFGVSAYKGGKKLSVEDFVHSLR